MGPWHLHLGKSDPFSYEMSQYFTIPVFTTCKLVTHAFSLLSINGQGAEKTASHPASIGTSNIVKFIEYIVVARDQSRDNDLPSGALEICWPAQRWKNNRLIK